MAFSGVATIVKVSDRLFRVTGLTLAGAASGTIGFSDKTAPPADVSLVAPEWGPYRNGENELVTLQDAVECRMNLTTDVNASVPISVVKTGVDHGDFVITLHNDTDFTESAGLELYIEFHS